MNKTLKDFESSLIQINKELRNYTNPIFKTKDWTIFCSVQYHIEKSISNFQVLIKRSKEGKSE